MSSVSDSTSCWRSSTLSLSDARLLSRAPPPASAAGAQAAVAAHTQM